MAKESRELLNNILAAARIGVKANTLEIWRTKGKGPKFIKLDPSSPRSPVRYDPSAIDTWLEERICTKTSQYGNHQNALSVPAGDHRQTPQEVLLSGVKS